MPSDWPPTPAGSTAAAVSLPRLRAVAFAAGFFVVLALLLIVGRLMPTVVPAL